MDAVIQILNKSSSVLVLDEIDKVNDLDFLYLYLEKVYRKTILLITNYKNSVLSMDERLKSRLLPELLEFKPYNQEETRGILEQRRQFAFVSGVWEKTAFDKLVEKTYELRDIRRGLYLLKESGNNAERRASRKIEVCDTEGAISKLVEFSQNDSETMDVESQRILPLITGEHKIGDLYKIYQDSGGGISYKTFQRKIEDLVRAKFIITKNLVGKEGNTTIVTKLGDKKLSEF